MKVRIGTSGWSYNHWKENFYPKGLASNKWLGFYAQHFPAVEINSTFYRTPSVATLKKWAEVVPDNFEFAIKASRYITHQKRLKECEESLAYFFKNLSQIQSKSGPVLFQLPPSFPINPSRLEAFIGLLEKDYRYTFEFRHPTWFTDEIYKLLSAHKIALCITDLGGKLSPEEVTGKFTYLRLHGPQNAYQGYYGPRRLANWQKKINKWLDQGIEVYCFFDNDEKGYAVEDANYLLNRFKK